MPPGPLVNLGGLTKPATVLIERISDAVGGLAKPWQIERVAEAESRAEIIRANTRIQISDLEERAVRRLVAEEGRKQANIEAISTGAIPLLENDSKPAEIDADWMTHFFERSRLVSDENLQALWSAILAGEANRPGRFSKRTLNIISELDQRDAELFQSLICSVVSFEESIFSNTREFIDHSPVIRLDSKFDLNTKWSLDDLLHLQDMGLVVVDYTNAFSQCDFGDTPQFKFNDVIYSIEHDHTENVDVGHVIFTRSGKELFELLKISINEDYFEKILTYWMTSGYKISCPIN